MGATNEIKPGPLDQIDVTKKAAIRDRIAPAGVVLVGVHAFEIVMLSVQEKPVLGSECEPSKTECGFKVIHRNLSVRNPADSAVEEWVIGMPKLRIGNGGGGLLEGDGSSRRNGLRG